MLVTLFILLIMFFFVNVYSSKKSLHMLQQNLYNENNRYARWVIKNKNQFVNICLFAIMINIIGLILISKIKDLSSLCLWILIGILLVYGFQLKTKQKQEKTKKGLVITARIKRLIMTTFILYLIPIICIGIYLNEVSVIGTMILILTILKMMMAVTF